MSTSSLKRTFGDALRHAVYHFVVSAYSYPMAFSHGGMDRLAFKAKIEKNVSQTGICSDDYGHMEIGGRV